MTPRNRILTYVTAGALVIATGVGCGVIGAAKKLAGNVQTITDFSEKLQKGLTLTYHAEYKDQDGKKIIVQQQPPKSVYVTDTGPLIITDDTIYSCDNSSGVMTCDKEEVTSTDDATAALSASSIGTGGFMAGELGISLLLAASLVPKAKIDKSSKKIAGQDSDCVKITNLDQATGDGDTDFDSFTMCITDDGVLSEFSGTDTDGKTTGEIMTSYTTKIDSSLFQPPPGAVINDSGNLPTAPPTETVEPSAPPDTAEPSTGPSPSPSE